MRTNNLKYIILATGALILSSCSEMLYTSLDVLRPAQVTFSKNANCLLIVNNTVKQPTYLGHTNKSLDGKTRIVTIDTDSIPLFCLASIAEEIENKEFFTSVQLLPQSLNASRLFSRVSPLDTDTIDELCKTKNADLILSLDKIEVNDEVSELYLNERNSFLSAFEVRYESYWTVHYPNEEKTTSLRFKDTIYWESESYYKIDKRSLPDRRNGIIDGALYVGKKTAERIIPAWEKVDRYFYNTSNKYLRMGMDSVYVKNWNSAIQSWQKAVAMKGTRTQAFAANNLAIAYEIIGNIDKAIEYSTMANDLFNRLSYIRPETLDRQYEYCKELWKRKREIELLKKQLGE